MEKLPFFWAAMAGLEKYHKGDYGGLGVYRVKELQCFIIDINRVHFSQKSVMGYCVKCLFRSINTHNVD